MGAVNNKTTEEAAIRELVEDWARAVRTRDLDGILANHSPDMLLFDLPPPLQSQRIGEREELKVRLTIGLRKIDGQWSRMNIIRSRLPENESRARSNEDGQRHLMNPTSLEFNEWKKEMLLNCS